MMPGGQSTWWMPPREHGAWAMLAFPFVSAVILARSWDWLILPAAMAVLAAFSIREPLVVLGRQAFVWRERRPESRVAARFLCVCAVALAAGGAALLRARDWRVLLGLGAGAAALLGVAVALTVMNRQRSVWLQVVSACGLSASALVGWLAARPRLDHAAWWLWVVHSAYSAAAVLVVHARLDARLAARRLEQADQAARSLRAAYAAQAVLTGLALACPVWGRPLLAAPLLLAAAVHVHDLRRLRLPESHAIPLRRVGLRALALAVVYSVLALAALW